MDQLGDKERKTSYSFLLHFFFFSLLFLLSSPCPRILSVPKLCQRKPMSVREQRPNNVIP